MGNGIIKEQNRRIIINNDDYRKIRQIFFIPRSSSEDNMETKTETKTEVTIGPPGIRGESKKVLWSHN